MTWHDWSLSLSSLSGLPSCAKQLDNGDGETKECLRSCDADHCSPSSGYRHLRKRYKNNDEYKRKILSKEERNNNTVHSQKCVSLRQAYCLAVIKMRSRRLLWLDCHDFWATKLYRVRFSQTWCNLTKGNKLDVTWIKPVNATSLCRFCTTVYRKKLWRNKCEIKER